MKTRHAGFTLVESVVAIAVVGVLFAVVAIFLRSPVQAYFDTTRRAELSDIADTALRRLVRDLRLALPNSVRVDATGRFLEFLLVTGGGRYRAQTDASGGGNALDFTSPSGDASFDVVGAMPAISAGHQIVIFNLGTGFTGADAWATTGNNRATVSGVSGSTVTLSAAKVFPFESPGQRFHVVDGPVTYECDLATGAIRRHWGYAIAATQPTPPSGASTALLASRVSDCGFAYNANELLQRYGTVSVRLTLTADGESANLHAQAHVPNIP